MTNFEDVLLDVALEEDLGLPHRDVTTEVLFDSGVGQATAKIVSKDEADIIVCGVGLVEKILQRCGGGCRVEVRVSDGEVLTHGETLLTMVGPPSTLLAAERTILNFLRHLSAVATLTKRYKDLIRDLPTALLDTRKTTPGFRQLEKYAVQCGGGANHRMGLYDAVMVKDTHVDMLGGMQQVLAKLKQRKPDVPVIIEVQSAEELAQVLALGQDSVDRVLLDNMCTAELRECVAMCQGKMATESSGNMTLSRIRAVAETGVDYISVGRLTHSAGTVDLSMKISVKEDT